MCLLFVASNKPQTDPAAIGRSAGFVVLPVLPIFRWSNPMMTARPVGAVDGPKAGCPSRCGHVRASTAAASTGLVPEAGPGVLADRPMPKALEAADFSLLLHNKQVSLRVPITENIQDDLRLPSQQEEVGNLLLWAGCDRWNLPISFA